MEPAAEVSESLSSVKTADLWECVFVFGETTHCEERKWGISSFKILLCHGTVASLPRSKINLYYPKKKVGDGWTKDWLLVSKLPRVPPLERSSFPSPPLPHRLEHISPSHSYPAISRVNLKWRKENPWWPGLRSLSAFEPQTYLRGSQVWMTYLTIKILPLGSTL